MVEINIGSSRDNLRKLAQGLLDECDRTHPDSATDAPPVPHVEYTAYGVYNDDASEEVTIVFSNEDMENREDLKSDAVIVDVDVER